MPKSGCHHGHHAHGHKHNRHPHRSSDNLLRAWEHVLEWFWSCCYCHEHGAMSTFIEQCPGCAHTRCDDCPMESTKIRVSTGQPANQSRTPLAPASQAPENFHCNDSLMTPVRVEREQPPDSNNNSLTAFAALSLAPSPEASASFQSSPSSIVFSLNGTQHSDSATDFCTENTETTDSGGSAFDDGESNEVVRLLDCQVLSLLNGDLELAARLIPKIHDRLREEDGLGWIGDAESRDEDEMSIAGLGRSKGKQQASGSSCSPHSGPSHSGSSSGKHGRASRDSRDRNEGSNPNKRSRRGRGRSSGNHPEDLDESGNGDPGENPAGDHSESLKDNEMGDAFENPDKTPGDPDGDPGSDPSITTSVGNSFNFACHFFKFDPARFSFWTDEKYEKCPGSRITQLRHIKYHFKKVHTQPSSSPFCRRCYRLFQNLDDLDSHAQETVPCNPTKKPPTLHDDINEEQWKEIDRIFCRKGQKHVDDISRWYEIWRILFPGEKNPPHPWVEPPGYIRCPTYDVEDFVSKFETRIAADESLQGEDHQIPDRYLYHLRQLLKEDNAAHGLLQFQSTGTASGENIDTSERSGSMSRIAAPDQQPDSPRLGAWGFGFPSEPLYQDTQVAVQSTGSFHSPRPFTSQMRVDTTSFAELMHAPYDPTISHSAIEYQYQLSMGAKNALNESQLDQFWGCDFDFEGADMLKLSALGQPCQPSVQAHIGPATSGECDPTTELSDINPSSENELAEDVLLPENTSLKAMEMWKNKHSGSSFLRRPGVGN